MTRPNLLPVDQMLERVSRAKADGDAAYFHDLMYLGELLTKLAVSAFLAALDSERSRNRYRLEFRLVRANSLGDWVEVLDECLVGPASQGLNKESYAARNELQSKQAPGTWQNDAASALVRALAIVDPQSAGLGTKVEGRHIFSRFSQLRNKTRGHGAIPPHVCTQIAPELAHALDLLYINLSVYRRSWAYLHQNLSGKYRVSALSGDTGTFSELARRKSSALPDGVYIYWNEPRPVALVHSDPEVTDVFIANGDFKNGEYEALSYRTGTSRQVDGRQYLLAPERLAESETEGLGSLVQQGQSFGNLPSQQAGYVARVQLEAELREVLLDSRNPVITLAGAGGIGKTSLALSVLHEIAESGSFKAILWFSARDIDLLASGPKQVSKSVASVKDIADQLVRLLEPGERNDKAFSSRDYLSAALTSSPLGVDAPMLFVFDNFETMATPVETFKWMNNQIRLGNKILITTRFREFQGDYHIAVSGMTDDEARQLIDQTAQAQGVKGRLDKDAVNSIVTEADGHPYVLKILVGEMAGTSGVGRVARIVASKVDILEALFERTYANLSPAARRIFLLLSQWRSTVPQLAVEAVVLRPANESLDVRGAIDEVLRMSLAEEWTTDDGVGFLSVPLAAGLFGRRKLETSPFKAAVEADLEILRLTGAVHVSDRSRGLAPRVKELFQGVARRLQHKPDEYHDSVEMLEIVARGYAPAWLLLAALHEEVGGSKGTEGVKRALRQFIESGPSSADRTAAWDRLAQLARQEGDILGELQAVIEMSQQEDATIRKISAVANRVNNILAARPAALDSDEKRILVRKLVLAMEARIDEGSADDHSRLAWLMLHLKNSKQAMILVDRGLSKEPNNYYCLNLKRKLELEQASRR